PETNSETKLTNPKRLAFENQLYSDSESESSYAGVDQEISPVSSAEIIEMGKLNATEFANMLATALNDDKIKESLNSIFSKDLEELKTKMSEIIKKQGNLQQQVTDLQFRSDSKDETRPKGLKNYIFKKIIIIILNTI
ncbi:MAG: hypothetical protein GY698_00005, partial [Actinomycetia bacterium]|nr:hypothetical protein [Actinomycetes bacterium]